MVSAEKIQLVFTGVGVTGIVCIGVSVAGGYKILAPVGVLLSVAGFAKKYAPRGDGKCNLESQTRFIKDSGSFMDAKDEDDKPIKVYCGEKGVLGLPFSEDAGTEGVTAKPQLDDLGLVSSVSPDVKTIYDLIFGRSCNDGRPALGRCVKMHTFKDAMKDGKPNPKPTIVDVPGEWATITFKEMKRQARAVGSFLRGECGIGQKEKVAIWSSNCVEWLVADLTCAVFNFTSVSVYDSLGPDAASYIVADSGSQVLIVEEKCLKRVPAMLDDETYKNNKGSDLKVVLYLGKGDDETRKTLESRGLKVFAFEEATKCEKILDDTPPTDKDISTIMYTSGTTGAPKGVMLAHLNLVATISMIDLTPSISLRSDDLHLSYLPLAHIFERLCSLGVLFKGGSIYFASSGARNLLADLSVVRPTLFAGVPKVYENVRDAVARKMTGAKKTLFQTALACKAADLETGCGYSPIWDMLVFSKTKKALGGRVRFCVSGGAPISKDTLQFVECALAPVVQGYGATETSAASTLTMAFDPVAGDVGPPLGTAAIRLVDVPEMNYYSGAATVYKDAKAKEAFANGQAKSGGEVWIGGPGVSTGYYDPSVNGLKKDVPTNKMSSKSKEEFFVEDGWSWFKTGDIGTWTDRGCLKIVDRKKNIFKTSLGEYVPVEEVEKVFQDNCQYADFVFLPKETKVAYVAVCVVVSDSIGTVMKWAKENGVEGDEKAVVGSEKFRERLHQDFEAAAKDKKMQRFLWVAKKNIHAEYHAPGYQEDWVSGVECANGQKEQLLTATFKPRRAQLDQFFAPVFPKIYPDRPKDHVLP